MQPLRSSDATPIVPFPPAAGSPVRDRPFCASDYIAINCPLTSLIEARILALNTESS
jgi:hypothetical protein